MKKFNGYSLMDTLLAILIISICIHLICICIYSYQNQNEKGIYENIDEEWFYTP